KLAATELYPCGIPFDEANIFRAHSPKVGRDLGENRFMTLAMAGRAGRNDDLTGGINAHLRALERTHAGSLHVTADADTKVVSLLPQLLLLFTQLFIACCFQCLSQSLGIVSAVVEIGRAHV